MFLLPGAEYLGIACGVRATARYGHGGALNLIYCTMTLDNHADARDALLRVLPHVDGAVVIDGGSTDETLPFLRGLERSEPKV